MTYGLDAIHELIEDSGWSYPVTVTRLEREHALENVKLDEDGQHMIMVSELFVDNDVDRFESREDLERKLEPIIESEIRSRQVSLSARLKQALFAWR